MMSHSANFEMRVRNQKALALPFLNMVRLFGWNIFRPDPTLGTIFYFLARCSPFDIAWSYRPLRSTWTAQVALLSCWTIVQECRQLNEVERRFYTTPEAALRLGQLNHLPSIEYLVSSFSINHRCSRVECFNTAYHGLFSLFDDRPSTQWTFKVHMRTLARILDY